MRFITLYSLFPIPPRREAAYLFHNRVARYWRAWSAEPASPPSRIRPAAAHEAKWRSRPLRAAAPGCRIRSNTVGRPIDAARAARPNPGGARGRAGRRPIPRRSVASGPTWQAATLSHHAEPQQDASHCARATPQSMPAALARQGAAAHAGAPRVSATRRRGPGPRREKRPRWGAGWDTPRPAAAGAETGAASGALGGPGRSWLRAIPSPVRQPSGRSSPPTAVSYTGGLLTFQLQNCSESARMPGAPFALVGARWGGPRHNSGVGGPAAPARPSRHGDDGPAAQPGRPARGAWPRSAL